MTRRARNGRFTAERTTKTTCEVEVTERVTVEFEEPPAAASLAPLPPPSRGGIDVLDPRFPIEHSLPASCFWEMAALRPDRPALAGLAARARAAEGVQQETFVVPFDDPAPVPVIRVPVARTYPELEEDTLAHEFSELDRDALTTVLEGPEELTMGRSI